MRNAVIAVAVLFISGLSWALRLVIGSGPWPADSAALLSAWILMMTAIAVVGMLVASARWARRLGAALALAGLALAVALPTDGLWWVGLVSSGAALSAMLGRVTSAAVRELPPAEGPPPTVVALLLTLAATPGAVAAVSVAGIGPGGWLGVGTAMVGLAWYGKAGPYAAWVARLVIPVTLAVAGGVVRSWPGLVLVVAAAAVMWLAWRPQSLVAVQPLITRSRGRPMFPELVPPEVLEAAGLDEKGRRKGEA